VTALGFAGGFGEAFLNGLLPVAIVWAGRYVKPAGFSRRQLPGEKGMLALLFGLAIAVSVLEVAYLLSS
jgi:tyrosine-specific transport protein